MVKKRRPLRRIFRWTRRLVSLVLILAVAGSGFVAWQLMGSRAQLDGEVTHPDLSSEVTVTRDHQGIPYIEADSRPDSAFALGYLHAQDRFFQMDLLRRNSAGELSALVGDAALDYDLRIRTHQFRHRGEQALNALPEDHRDILEHYVSGVNHGLNELRVVPFEYLLLGTSPEPWRPQDTLLALYSMYLDLQPEWNDGENSRGLLRDVVPADWFDFLQPDHGEWDAVIAGDTAAYAASLPEQSLSALVSELNGGLSTAGSGYRYQDVIELGSNSWSAGGDHTAHGGGMVANDMHLGLSVPNIWYRATWQVPGADRAISGATLPGAPAMVVGSNEHVAWAFTNSNGDYHDTILLETRNDDREYLTPDGWENFETVTETVSVAGGDSVDTNILLTRWGPVIGRDHNDRLMAMRWVAHDPEGANLNLLRLETASTVDDVLPIAAQAGVPGQNAVVVDRHGDQAWTIMGRLPERFGDFDGREPRPWGTGDYGWSGYLQAADYPVVRNPEAGRIWTGNALMVADEQLERVGQSGYALGARQQQIRDRLLAQDEFSEADFLAIQMDHEAIFLSRWQGLLVEVLADVDSSTLTELRDLVADWSGHAAADDVGYRAVKVFRETVIDHTIGEVYRAIDDASDGFFSPGRINNRVEYPVWALLSDRPEVHLPSGFDHWDDVLLTAAEATVESLTEDGQPLAEQTWGKANTLDIRHPLAGNIPVFGRFLVMPAEPMNGDTFMPLVQRPDTGASQRMVVAPGQEADGLFHMATGQSSHPWSPFFSRGHSDWVEGNASPLLPGEAKHTLRFQPVD